MTVTLDLNPDAVWEDGSPITVDDFAVHVDADLNTPASLSHGRLRPDHVVDRGRERQAGRRRLLGGVRAVQEPLQPDHQGRRRRRLQRRLGRLRHRDPVLGSPVDARVVEPEQAILVPNEAYWDDEAAPSPSAS